MPEAGQSRIADPLTRKSGTVRSPASRYVSYANRVVCCFGSSEAAAATPGPAVPASDAVRQLEGVIRRCGGIEAVRQLLDVLERIGTR
jgi:hypothetical protein